MPADVEALIKSLADFRQRSGAKEELVAMGAAAEPALVAALDHRKEAVVWCAVKALEEMRAKSAVGPLVAMLKAGRGDQPHIRRALETITGEKLGEDIAAWERYLRGRRSSAESAVAAKKPTKRDLVSAAIAGTGFALEEVKGGLCVTVELGGGRQQRVTVLGAKDPEEVPLIVFYTECGAAEPARYEWALRKNVAVPYGAYAIRTVDGKQLFVMVQTLVREYATPGEILSCIRTLAEKGDVLERYLKTEDVL